MKYRHILGCQIAVIVVVSIVAFLGMFGAPSIFAQTMDVDGVALDSTQRAELIQAQEAKTQSMARIEKEVRDVLRFLTVRASPVIQSQAEQDKVDDAVAVVKVIAKRLWESQAGEPVTGVSVKRSSLERRLSKAQRALDRLRDSATPEEVGMATVARDLAQGTLDAFNVAHPE